MIDVEPKMRIELTTYALRVRCSTPELPGRVFTQDNLTVSRVFRLVLEAYVWIAERIGPFFPEFPVLSE
jgi:hypothetical protein